MKTFLSLGLLLVLKWAAVHANFDVRSLTSDENYFLDVATKYEESFNTLASKYEQQADITKVDVVEDMKVIMRTYCEGESFCDLAIDEAFDAADETFKDGTLDISLPENMDSALKVPLERAIEAILPLDEENHDEVIETLKEIKREIEEVEGVEPFSKQFVVGAIDTALKGVTFWHAVFYDEENPMYPLVGSHNDRRLQSCAITATGAAISVISGIVGYLSIFPRAFITGLFIPSRVPIIKWFFKPIGIYFGIRFFITGLFRFIAFSIAPLPFLVLPGALCLVKVTVVAIGVLAVAGGLLYAIGGGIVALGGIILSIVGGSG